MKILYKTKKVLQFAILFNIIGLNEKFYPIEYK